MIVLVGFMGAGKSSVGPLLAKRLNLPFVDSDKVVEQKAGAAIPEIFTTGGEAAFRSLEREVVAEVLAGPDAVVALGGGALGDPVTCAALEWTTVVHLQVDVAEALTRIGDPGARPMLAREDPRSLYERRAPTYARVADLTVATDDRPPGEVADLIAAEVSAPETGSDKVSNGADDSGDPAAPRRIHVELGPRSYDVLVGAGLATSMDSLVPLPSEAERAVVVTHPGLKPKAAQVVASLSGAGLQTHIATVAEGEASKSLAGAQELLEDFAAHSLHRNDLVVGLGGGVITDLAGFTASTYHRGVAVVHLPTTLLGQVDAAIGGKTGVNLPAGKNLVGTFHQPLAVLCDVDLLEGLPEAELRSGLAEVTKYGFLSDPFLLDVVEKRSEDLVALDRELVVEVVARCADIKAGIVSTDEREGGRRAWLNYGHTFGHAIEKAAGFEGVRHGEAVSLGMVAASLLAFDMNRVNEACVERHKTVLSAAGLPVTAKLELGALESAWVHDKKYRRGVRFVLLMQPDDMHPDMKERGLGVPQAGVSAPQEAIERALTRLAS
jgi:shikimate kinase / 3-dehydroquinate synthase